jgi:protein-tyrosine-phosphatase
MGGMVEILFVCSANRFRSVIAAEYFRSLLKNDNSKKEWQVSSAGTWAINGMYPISQAIVFGKSRGLAIETVLSRELDRELLHSATMVIVMTESQRESLDIEFPEVKTRVFLLSEICVGQLYDIPDPVEEVDETGMEIGDEICTLISSGFERICNQAKQIHDQRI